MDIRFLLDTNILSEPSKPLPNAQVAARLAQNSGSLATATIVYHELMFGYFKMPDSRKKRVVETYIRRSIEGVLTLLPYCEAAALWHAAERVRLSTQGKAPAYADGQIAAIAATNNLTLVTRNVNDFQHFQDLKVENWFE